MNTVSIIVATYRRDTELKNALESLAEQSCQGIEVVLVDDNADSEWNAKVATIVEAFRENHREIPLCHIVNPENQGSAATRNIGIQAATGEYITFLDDDDIYLPDKVKKQAEFMAAGGYDYTITDLVLYNEEGKETDRRIRSYILDTTVDSLRIYHLKYHMTGTDTMMFRREYLLKIGGFAPINVGDEFYLMLRAIDGGGKFGYLPGCDIKAYVHTGETGLSSGESKIQGENALYAYKKTFFEKLDPQTKRYIKMRHYAVLAFAELRRKRYIYALFNAIKAFVAAPVACMKLIISR